MKNVVKILLLFGACSAFSPALDAKEGSAPLMKPPTAIILSPGEVSGTVEDANRLTRSLKVRMPDGRVEKIRVGREVANFGDIKKGDVVKLQYFDAVAIAVEKKGTVPHAVVTEDIEVSQGGASTKRMLHTTQVSATVDSIDMGKRMVTLRYPDGLKRTVKVEDSAKLDSLKQGDEVVVQLTEAYAISVNRG